MPYCLQTPVHTAANGDPGKETQAGPGNLHTEASVNTTLNNFKSKLRLSWGLTNSGRSMCQQWTALSHNLKEWPVKTGTNQQQVRTINTGAWAKNGSPVISSARADRGREGIKREREKGKEKNKDNTVAQPEPARETQGPWQKLINWSILCV